MGGGRRQSGLRCPGKNVQRGHRPVRVIQRVESFKAELKYMTFLVRHPELLVYFGVKPDDSRSLNRIASDTAKLSGRSFGKGSQIPIARGGWIVYVRIYASGIRPIVAAGPRTRVIDTADAQGPGHPALK